MGIRGLRTALRPLASRVQLADSAVIDGPAFAYHILFSCRLKNGVSNALQDPAYPVLASAAIQWLDKLQLRGIQVKAVYFDGYLPASKKDLRLARLVEKSTASNRYFSSTKSGIARGVKPRRQANPPIPIPAFLVPAVLGALRTSDKYGPLTHLVPGEADSFCAHHVCREGGALLTSDSDLLLYDLGPNGSVVFFEDMEMTAEDPQQRSVATYSQQAICERLSLEPGQQAMLSLAFEMGRAPYHQIAWYAALVKRKCSANEYPAEYADFISEYVRGSDTSSTDSEYLRYLDPRVSEFLLGWSTRSVGPVFYLPLLLDRWDQESAWAPSIWIRQMAYSFCPNPSPGKSTVAEYRRTMSLNSAGKSIELLGRQEMTEAAHKLLSSCQAFSSKARGPSALGWVSFCFKQEIEHAAEQGKVSLVREALTRASKSKGKLEAGSWDTAHLTAQIQGTLYSLRILFQVLQCLGGPLVTPAWPQLPVNRLMDCLCTVPPIGEFPSIMDVAGLCGQLKDAGELEHLFEMAGMPVPVPEGTRRASERMMGPAARQEGRKARPLQSANLFDALLDTGSWRLGTQAGVDEASTSD